jgi:hypothetical protein
MKRRQRVNSVEGDLLELGALHDALRRDRRELTGVATSEGYERRAVEETEGKARRQLMRIKEREKKDVQLNATKEALKAAPPPMVAAMGELFLKSRELDRQMKETRRQARGEEHQRELLRYRAKQQRLLHKMHVERAALEEKRHEHIAGERQRRSAALEHSREVLADTRSRSCMSMAIERRERRQGRVRADQERLAVIRGRIDDDHRRSLSPSRFLQLPPLHSTQTSRPRDEPTDSRLLKILRASDKLKAATPIDEWFCDSSRASLDG